MDKRKHWEGIKLAIKRGLTTPTLPEDVRRLNNRWYVIILRVLGIVSIVCLLCKEYLKLSLSEVLVAMFIEIIYLIYGVVISVIRFKHIRKVVKSGELDIRNSPRDKWKSILGNSILCMKGLCVGLGYLGASLGLMEGLDSMIRYSGRESGIRTLIGNGINKVLPPTEGQYKKYIGTYMELNEKKERGEGWLKKAKEQGDVRKIKIYEEVIKESNKKMEALNLRIEGVEEYLERKGKKK